MRLRPRAEVICFKRGKTLCGFNPDKGYCLFPGGGVDPNESAIEAAKREAWEEADRRVVNCTVAHEPTVQLWPDGYAEEKGMEWARGYKGGYTYWMTGSTSDDPFHDDPKDRHEDYEDIFTWHPIPFVIEKLKGEVKGDWAEDVKVRIKILQQHQLLSKRHKQAQALARCAGLDLPDLSIAASQSFDDR